MISVLPLNRVIVAVALVYAAVAAAVLSLIGSETALDAVSAVLGWGTFLNLFLLIVGHTVWQTIWEIFPQLNEVFFPNLNGQWRMRIHWFAENKSSGVVDATANIKQSLFGISMEVDSPGSESETLAVKPKRDPESGRAIVYYVYRVFPKRINSDAGDAYEGSAILKPESANSNCLRGNYHTSRKTVGHFELRRLTN